MNDVLYFWLALGSYLAATILYALNIALKPKILGRLALGVLVIGFVTHTVGLVVRTIASGHTPFTGMFEYSSSLAWAIVLFYLIFQFRFNIKNLGAFVAPLAFAVIVVASLFPMEIERQLVPALQSYWLQIHVSLALIAQSAFAVAFATSVMYLLKLRGSKRLPSLEVLDEITYSAIVIGYPLFTIGALFAGAVWAWKAWGSPWSWDPKEVGSLVVWLIYSAYLHARLVGGWRGKRSAMLSILGFGSAVFSFVGNLFVSGLHAYI